MADLKSKLSDRILSVGFIGAGNMAQAIIGSMLKAGLVDAGQLTVSAPSDTRLAPLRGRGITTTHNNVEVMRSCDVVFLCVKPHLFCGMIKDAKLKDDPENDGWCNLFVSVMTGLTLSFLQEELSNIQSCYAPAVVRAMPNTPCLVGEGCCVYALGTTVSEQQGVAAQSLLGCLGFVRPIPEGQINAAAAVAGSGPAYFYAAIEAMADGGVKMGLPRELAQSLAAQTVRGAATMVQQTGRHPGQLKDEVCSPGGTTIAAMHVLERAGFRNGLMSAVEAATERAQELARKQMQ